MHTRYQQTRAMLAGATTPTRGLARAAPTRHHACHYMSLCYAHVMEV